MADCAVVVAGGGPVGLATAFGLAQAGIEVTVLDRAESVGTAPRAIAYLYPVLDGFERLGLLEELQNEGLRSEGLNFIDHETGEHLPQSLDALAGVVRHPYTLQLGQDQISRVLLRHLNTWPNVDIQYGTEVIGVLQDETGVTVRVASAAGEEALRCAWLVGADGASSTVRQLLGIAFDGFTWPDRFVATNIRYDFEAHGLRDANWRIDSTFGAIIGKITRDGLWRYTYREPADLPLDAMRQRIDDHLAVALPGGGEYKLEQFSPYRMHQRAAETFRRGRVLLAGDAAHITNPTGGLGLAGGFLDSFVLHEALTAVITGVADEPVLDAYADQRRRVFLDVVSPMAVRNKNMVFDPPPGPARAELVAALRELSRDPVKRRDDLLRMQATATPSLVPGSGSRR